jgi:hypothetical protein
MDDDGFELPVMYRGQEVEFPAKLIRYGYSYKIEVTVNDMLVAFEPDEERNWRALIDPEIPGGNKSINIELLEAISIALDSVTK